MSDLEQLLAEEGDYAEQHRDDPIPPNAVSTRPNRAKSVMFSLRLNPDELTALHELAREREVPASALVRGWIMQHVAAEHNAPSTTAAALERLEADVRALRNLVAS
jgi:hypothetical protein